jgi:RNA polymerase sigma factor (sigma-70 family)
MPQDTEWIEGLRQGREQAFVKLRQKAFRSVAQLVQINGGNATDAEEVFQEGCVLLYEQLRDGLRLEAAAPSTYLYALCRNIWRNQWRKQQKIPVQFNDYQTDIPEVAADQEPDLTESQLQMLERALAEGSDKCRELLVRFYYRRQSMEQIAQALGYSNADTVKTTKNRCMSYLREKIVSFLKNK